LLDYQESEEQKLLRQTLTSILSDFGDDYWRSKDEKGEFPREYFDTLAANGWFKLNLPEKYGGAGLGLTETSIAIHEASRRAGMAAGDILMAICVFAIQTIKSFASDSVKDHYLPELGSGKHVMSFCLTEPSAGVNTLDVATRAESAGDGYTISGQKIWITLAHEATIMSIVARTTPKEKAAKRTEGLTIFLLDKRKIKSGRIRTKRIDDISMRALGSNEVFFDDVFVPAENILGEKDRGWDLLPSLLNAERISTAAMSVGLGELALEKACNYARERKVFGKPIGANQAIQFPLARAKVELEAAWGLAQKAAWQFDKCEDCSVAANVAAYLGARAAFFASDRAMQTYGGLAFAKTTDVERHWRDSRLFRTGPVPEEMVLSFLGQHVLKLPRSF
jgi:acyl-CoA dehydrogenase